ncbi:MAG: AsmA family protein [Thermodesulfobacteriota bacterium]|nr:AsmA family protein [Thermodesulfobacteriota bacterium]
MTRILKYIGIFIAGIVGLLILAVAVINLIPGDKYKNLISSSVKSATGRELEIEGDLDIRLFSTFGFKASGIKFANADWGSRPQMVSGGDIEAEVALFPLLKGIIDVTLLVDAPDLVLETHSSGQGNWEFIELVEDMAEEVTEVVKTVEEIETSLEEAQSKGGFPLRLRIQQVIIQGNLAYIDGTSGEQTTAGNVKLIIKPAGDRLTVELEGKFNDIPLALSGGFDNVDFFVNNQSAPVSFDGHFGDAKLEIRGTAGPLAPTYDLDVNINLNTDSLAAFSPLAGQDLPDIGPLAVSAKLIGKDGKYAVSDLLATLEDKTITAEIKASIADLVALNGLTLKANVNTDQLTKIVRTAGFQSEFSLPDSLNAEVVAAGDLENLGVSRFQATIQGQGLSIDTTAQAKNIMTLEGVSADFLLKAESLDYIAGIAQTELPPLGPLQANANIRSTGEHLDRLEIKADLTGDIIHADVTGSIEDPANLKGVNGDLNLALDSLDWLADYLKTELPPLGALKGSAHVASKGDTFELTDINANLDGENITAKVTGTIGDLMAVQGVNATVDLGVQSLAFLSKYIEMELPPLGPVQASADINSQGDTFEAKEIKVDLAGDKLHAKVEGSVGDLINLKGIDARIDFGVQSLAVLSGVAQTDLPSLGPLKGSASIASKGDTFELKEMKIDLTDDKIQAKVAASVGDVLKLAGINADINFSVDSLTSLNELAKQELPAFGPVTLEGKIASKGGLEAPAYIDTVIKSDGVMASLKGTIAEPLAARGIDLALNVEADSAQHLGKLIGTDFVSTDPVKLEGKLTSNNNSYELAGLNLQTGKLDVKGKAAFQQPAEPGDRPRVSAALHVSELDFTLRQKAKLEAAEKEIESTENENEEVVADDEDKKEKVFPSHPLPWEPLRTIDADIEVTVDALKTLQLVLEKMIAKVTLDNGLLTLKPLQAKVGDGTFGGSATLDARNSPATLAVDIELSNATFRDFGGTVNFLVDLKGSGNSVAEIMAGLDGQLEFDVREATLKRSFMTGFGSGLLSSLNPFTEQDENTELICAIILFDITDGIADANKKIAAQMTDVTWFGSGEINLRTEEIDFGMSPKARKGIVNMGSLAGLGRLGGTLSHPKIEFAQKDMAVKYGKYSAAVATGGLTLLADIVFSKIKANQDVCAAILEDLDTIQVADEKSEGKTEEKTEQRNEKNAEVNTEVKKSKKKKHKRRSTLFPDDDYL